MYNSHRETVINIVSDTLNDSDFINDNQELSYLTGNLLELETHTVIRMERRSIP